MRKHIAFIGAGAVGGYVGAQLARAGEDVSLIDAWPGHIDAVKRDGMRGDGGTFAAKNEQEYCWMWTARNAKARVEGQVEIKQE